MPKAMDDGSATSIAANPPHKSPMKSGLPRAGMAGPFAFPGVSSVFMGWKQNEGRIPAATILKSMNAAHRQGRNRQHLDFCAPRASQLQATGNVNRGTCATGDVKSFWRGKYSGAVVTADVRRLRPTYDLRVTTAVASGESLCKNSISDQRILLGTSSQCVISQMEAKIFPVREFSHGLANC